MPSPLVLMIRGDFVWYEKAETDSPSREWCTSQGPVRKREATLVTVTEMLQYQKVVKQVLKD